MALTKRFSTQNQMSGLTFDPLVKRRGSKVKCCCALTAQVFTKKTSEPLRAPGVEKFASEDPVPAGRAARLHTRRSTCSSRTRRKRRRAPSVRRRHAPRAGPEEEPGFFFNAVNKHRKHGGALNTLWMYKRQLLKIYKYLKSTARSS